MNCCGAGFGIDVGVGLGDPVRLPRGVPPMGEGKSRGCSWCVGRATLTYCQRSWGCLLAAAVGVGDVVLGMLAVVSEGAGCSVWGVAGIPAKAG